MKKTKIVCSIGPSSSSLDTFLQMVEKGMNVARINFSHETQEGCEKILHLVEETNARGNHVAIMYDTKGPDFRTGIIQEGGISLQEGELIEIVKEDVVGTKDRFSVNYKHAIDILQIHDIILIEDGLFKLEVIDKREDAIVCRILVGGILNSHKGINVPGVNLEEPFLSETDIADIKYACHHQGDFIALSFVSSKEDVLSVRRLITSEGSNMQIISKIESTYALDNLDDIIDVSDGIMVARGDLGVEVPMKELPIIQKDIIRRCRKKGKLCIVATEMLSSMTQKIRPTRAEVSDVANAVLDGADAVMLSNETTVGKFPVEAVSIMADTCENTEKYLEYENPVYPKEKTIMDTIAHSVAVAANSLDVKAVLASTLSGETARHISALRPRPIILALTTESQIARSLALSFGVYPYLVPLTYSTDEIIEHAIHKGKEVLNLQTGDLVVITGGFPQSRKTNFLKIEEI